jgi:hypothetical protein
MRQKLLASAALVLGAALAAPAAADITVTGTVVYDKDVAFVEVLTKVKTVVITVSVDKDASTAAESNAVNNQRIGGCGGGTAVCSGYAPNVHTYTTGEIPTRTGRVVGGIPIDYLALIQTSSVVQNVGVTQFNQDVGVGANQANMISAAVAETAFFIEANNSAAQYNFGNSVTVDGKRLNGTAPDTVGVIHGAGISGSVNLNVGVTQVNQNAGVFNNQLNTMSLAFSWNNSAVAMAESDLGQWNSGGAATETNTSRAVGILGSVNNNIGVVMGNQSAGYMGNQANVVSISAGGLF